MNEKAGEALGYFVKDFVKDASQKLTLLGLYEVKLASKIADLGEEAKKKWAKLLSGNKLRSAVLSTVLNQGSKYAAGTGYMKQLKMLQASIERSSAELIKDGKELQYLIDEFKKLQEMGYTKETWKDSLSSLLAFLKLYQQIHVECGLAVLECICADPLVKQAIGATTCMIEINGDLPSSLLILLNKGPGNHIRDNAYKYIKRMEKDLSMIQRIQANQDRIIALIGLAITSAFIGVSNVAANFVVRTFSRLLTHTSTCDAHILSLALSRARALSLSLSLSVFSLSRAHAVCVCVSFSLSLSPSLSLLSLSLSLSLSHRCTSCHICTFHMCDIIHMCDMTHSYV